MEDLFDTIAGLPIHPLVVHAAVVLLPLGALGLIAMVVKPALQERYGSLIMAVIVMGAGSAFVADQSGEALAARVGSPGEHEEWGERLVMSAMLLTVVALVWWIRQRRSQRSGSTAAGAGRSQRRNWPCPACPRYCPSRHTTRPASSGARRRCSESS